MLRTPGIGPVTYRQLIARFGTPSAALAAVPIGLIQIATKALPPSVAGLTRIASLHAFLSGDLVGGHAFAELAKWKR